jgi:hypothetical protein
MQEKRKTNGESSNGAKANSHPLRAAYARIKLLPISWWIIGAELFGVVIIAAVSYCLPNLKERMKLFTDAALGWLVFVVVAAQAYIYRQQWDAMHSALEIERTKSNPRLRVSKIRIENFEAGASPIFITTIANDGLIDATGVELHIGIGIGTRQEFNWGDPQTVMIPARGKESYPAMCNAILNEELVKGLNANIPIEVKVRVKYWPISPKEPTEFCYRYLPWPTQNRPDDVPQFVPCDFNPQVNTIVRIPSVFLIAKPGNVTAVVEKAPPKEAAPKEETNHEDEGDSGNPN